MASETDAPETTDRTTGESAGGRLLDYRRRERLLSVSLHVVAALLVAFLWGSATIATTAAAIATVLGVLASFAITRYRFKLRELYRTFGIIPMVVPGIILGVALASTSRTCWVSCRAS